MLRLALGALSLLLLLPPCAVCQCELAFTVNPALSNFTVGGGVLEPIPAPLKPTNPDALVGLEGRLLGLLPGACPDDVPALLELLEGASFETVPELGPLSLYPDVIQVGRLRCVPDHGLLAPSAALGLGFCARA